MSVALIVLAAGKGTRMQSALPKVLHEIGNAPLLAHALASGATLEPERSVVVVGHEGHAVAAAAGDIDENLRIAEQTEQLGTGHAVLAAKDAMAGFEGDVVILYGDTPFIKPETLKSMQAARQNGADLVVLGFEPEDPARYGRLDVRDGALKRIVEYKDATEAEREITLCNSGVVMADATRLFALLEKIEPSQTTGEIYLTDLAQLMNEDGGSARVVTCDQSETQGIDDRAALAAGEAQFQINARAQAFENGVIMAAPETLYFSQDTVIGRDAIIEPFVVFGPGVSIESGAHIRAFSHLEGTHVSQGAVAGPYARLRPGTELGPDTKIGNFVETKNALIADGAKVNHLSYVGDADVGSHSNIGAGTITCNYDGVMKHRTEIGKNVFVGSNTMLVAPVKMGDESMSASGSVITKDVDPGALAIARSAQTVKPGLAIKLMNKLRAIKAAKKE